MANKEWSAQELKNKAGRYCAMAEHCVHDVRSKLGQWGADEKTTDSIIEYLLNNKFIDQQRYCAAFTTDKMRYAGWGKTKIRYALKEKQIKDADIEYGIKNIDENEYISILCSIITKQKTRTDDQLIRFCMQRGFTYSEIKEALKMLQR